MQVMTTESSVRIGCDEVYLNLTTAVSSKFWIDSDLAQRLWKRLIHLSSRLKRFQCCDFIQRMPPLKWTKKGKMHNSESSHGLPRGVAAKKKMSAVANDGKYGAWRSQSEVCEDRHHRVNVKLLWTMGVPKRIIGQHSAPPGTPGGDALGFTSN